MIGSVYYLIIILITQQLCIVSPIKFGFIICSEKGIFSENFVAFGELPDDITELEKVIISNNLNKFYRFHRKEKERTRINPEDVELKNKFSVELFDQIKLSNGDHQVALKGELSNFLALFRFSMINSINQFQIWERVKFYSDPIINVHEIALKSSSSITNVKVLLIRAAFDNLEILPNNDLKVINHFENGDEKHSFSFASAVGRTQADFDAFEEGEDEIDGVDDDDDSSRYTVIDFTTSTDSLQSSLVGGHPRKGMIKSKSFKKGDNCCTPCTIC